MTTALVLTLVACTIGPGDSDLPAYEKDLRLTIRPVTPSARTGARLQIDFTLENLSSRQLTACRYGESSIHFWGLEERYAKARLGPVVDHQYCQLKMKIAPYEKVGWTENIVVPDLQTGQSKITASVRLVDPSHCDQYGCNDALVSASADEPVMISNGAANSALESDFGPPRW